MNKNDIIKFLKNSGIYPPSDEAKMLNRFDAGSRSPCRNFLQVWGLPRTGTNFVACLMQDNFNIFFTKWFGYKHDKPFYQIDWTGQDWHRPYGLERPKKVASGIEIYTEVEEAVRTKKFFHVMTVKNPYSWYISNLSHGGGGVHTRDGKVRIRDGTSGSGTKLSWMDWYNMRNNEYIKYIKDRPETSIIIRYEDYYYNNVENVVEKIGEKFNLERTTEKIEIRDYLVGMKSELSAEPRDDGKRYHNWKMYEDRFYLDYFDDDSLKFVNDNVDKSIMEYFNYEFV